jgi:hypothetical protein
MEPGAGTGRGITPATLGHGRTDGRIGERQLWWTERRQEFPRKAKREAKR